MSFITKRCFYTSSSEYTREVWVMTFEVEPNIFDGRSILKSSRAINLLNGKAH